MDHLDKDRAQNIPPFASDVGSGAASTTMLYVSQHRILMNSGYTYRNEAIKGIRSRSKGLEDTSIGTVYRGKADIIARTWGR